MSAELLLSRLESSKKTGNGRWMARCPAHKDSTASLAIRETEDGKILCHCFAGCNIGEVLSAVGLKVNDLFPERLSFSKGERHPFSAYDTLKAIAREVMIVSLCGARLLDGKLSTADRERLFLATSRINSALDLAGVRYG